jgi:hypothetical protein
MNAAKSFCVPGVYTVKTSGTYGSTAAGLCGIIGPPDNPVPLEGTATFVLESQLQGEFSTVGNGCITAPPPADGGYDIMWRGGITGDVNCGTGEFVGELRSTYNVTSFCDLGVARRDYFAKGIMRARFDPEQQTFVQGSYELHEPAVLFPLGSQPGGSGTWSAVYDADAQVPGDDRDCIGIPFPDTLFSDAGT